MIEPQINLEIIFRKISVALAEVSDDDLRRLSDSQYTLDFKIIRQRNNEEKSSVLDEISVEAAIHEITSLPNREEARTLLELKFSSKKSLEILARNLDIPITKKDKVEELRDKIVEATVGARMRSQAILGTNTSS